MRERLNKIRAERYILEQDIKALEQKISESKYEKERAEEAHAILIQATNLTQKNIGDYFSDLVNKAFCMIWENPYSFLPEFIERRNRIECDLWFVRNGKKMKPRFATGGGPKDVASFILRLAYARLERTDSLLILDEPFKNLDTNALPSALEMMQFLCDKFNIQILMNTHRTQIVEQANKTFPIENLKKRRERR